MARTNKVTGFRKWVQDLWYENCEEHETYKEPKYTQAQYWEKYKYWLKREYRYLKRTNNV